MLKRTLAILLVLVVVLSFSATALAGQKANVVFLDDSIKVHLPDVAKIVINNSVRHIVPGNATPAGGNPFEVAGR